MFPSMRSFWSLQAARESLWSFPNSANSSTMCCLRVWRRPISLSTAEASAPSSSWVTWAKAERTALYSAVILRETACLRNLPEVWAISRNEPPSLSLPARSTASSMALTASLQVTAFLLYDQVSSLMTSLMMTRCCLFWMRFSEAAASWDWALARRRVAVPICWLAVRRVSLASDTSVCLQAISASNSAFWALQTSSWLTCSWLTASLNPARTLLMVSMGPPFLSLFSTSTITCIMERLLVKSKGYLDEQEALASANTRRRATIAFIVMILMIQNP